MDLLPDNILLDIFNYLPVPSLIQAAYSCKNWYRVAMDDFLWKNFLYRHWRIPRSVPMLPGKQSWYEEYKRLQYFTPTVECQVIKEHKDQVLHVSFSHNGNYFATSSKDGLIKVWMSTHPVTLKYQHDMKPEFNWKYTQYSVFNHSDSLLLVSGVHFGNMSTSGEIAVFSLVDNFELQCRVINKPYDVFGTWYNDSHLVSGNLHWTGHLNSCSALWLNKATQDIESEHESVVMQWLKFNNKNASSIRTVMIANCPPKDVCTSSDVCEHTRKDNSTEVRNNNVTSMETAAGLSQCTDVESSCSSNPASSKECELLNSDALRLNATIEYNKEYWDAQSRSRISQIKRQKFETDTVDFPCACCDTVNDVGHISEVAGDGRQQRGGEADVSAHICSNFHSCLQSGSCSLEDCDVKVCRKCLKGDDLELLNCDCLKADDLESLNCDCVIDDANQSVTSLAGSGSRNSCTSTCRVHDPLLCDKLLIFTRGTLTYTPHQIGIKRVKSLESFRAETRSLSNGPVRLLLPSVEENNHGIDRPHDEVDEVIDMDGHIIGMSLSPDHKYLYVNSRPWPQGYHIENPLHPPPIAQEIDIHVIDLQQMKEVGTMLRAHKAYTANDECFFIFLDVCHEYVASGAEDKHGYIWDRHYGICLNKFAHSDVVNSVAFNPRDSQMLVTVSDDNQIKIWRSKNQCKQFRIEHKV